MSTEDNKKLSRRFLEELWNQKNLSVIDELLADDYIDHTPSLDPSGKGPQGREAIKQLFEQLSRFTDGVQVSIEDQIAEEDEVTTRVTWEFTFKSDGPFADSQFIVTGVGIDRIEDDQIVESWNTTDVPHRLLNLLERDADTSAAQPSGASPPSARRPVPCSPSRRCPPGFICRFGTCHRV